MKHELTSEHTKLNEKEVASLLKKYDVTLKELPKILVTDPAISELSVKEGDIIKIKRKSSTSGETIFYRGVVK